MNDTDQQQAQTPPGELSYEEAIRELEAITDRIESGEIGLEASVKAYERGVTLLKRCRELLDDAEQRIDELSGDDLSPEAPDAPDAPGSGDEG